MSYAAAMQGRHDSEGERREKGVTKQELDIPEFKVQHEST